MGPIHAFWLILLGLAGVASLVMARGQDPASARARWARHQGWFAVVSVLWGLWALVAAVRSAGWREFAPVFWYTFLAAGLAHFALGMLLSVGVLHSFVSNPAAELRVDRYLARLAGWQGAVGVLAVGLGGWMIAAGFVAHP
jgi:hypothetical protein